MMNQRQIDATLELYQPAQGATLNPELVSLFSDMDQTIAAHGVAAAKEHLDQSSVLSPVEIYNGTNADFRAGASRRYQRKHGGHYGGNKFARKVVSQKFFSGFVPPYAKKS